MPTTTQAKKAKPCPKKAAALTFRDGYMCAVANIMRTHGDSTIAEDVLRNYGGIDLSGIDSGDLKILKPLAEAIERKGKR